MDLKSINGRLLAVEALLTELMRKMPHEEAAAIISSAVPGLQRVNSNTATDTTVLLQTISQRIRR